MRDETITSVAAILAIMLTLLMALYKEVNGTMLAAGIAVLAGLGGYELRKRRE